MNRGLMTASGLLFIFLMTTLGALVVIFFKKNISRRLNGAFLGFASGIMIASSIWSLIIPSMDGASNMDKLSFLPALIGIIVGSIFMIVLGKIVPEQEGEIAQDVNKCKRLFVAVTVHNIPEGLAVGFAFGLAFAENTMTAYTLAAGLAFGIGLQNFPEGAAVALPIRAITGSRSKGFLYGMLSGIVEPIFGLLGYFLAAYLIVLQPWCLAFAAGAMLYIVASDLLASAHENAGGTICAVSFIIGFSIMMTLDVVLG